jgi:hypothetical protein
MHPALRQLLRSFVCLALLLACLAPVQAGTEQQDEKVIAEMRTRLRELQQQMVGLEDPQEMLRLQKQVQAIIDETMGRVSPRARAMLDVGLTIMQPIQAQSTAYITMVNDYFSSPESDFTSLQARVEIRPLVTRINALIAANQKLIEAIEAIPAEAARIVAGADMSADERAGFEQGLLEGLNRQMAPLRAIRNLDARIYALLVAALEQLDRDWGKWQPGSAPIEWSDPKLQEEFDARTAEIVVLSERQTKAQEALVNRK